MTTSVSDALVERALGDAAYLRAGAAYYPIGSGSRARLESIADTLDAIAAIPREGRELERALELARRDLNHLAKKYGEQEFVAPTICEITALQGDTPQGGGVLVIDLEQNFWRSLVEAASQSKWMPPEYMMNDWVADCRDYLIDGPSTFAMPAAGDTPQGAAK